MLEGDIYMFIGSRLKKLRKERNLTQSELGDLLNVTKVSVCCYEKGTRIPSLETLDDLSNIFGVRSDYFLGKDVAVVGEDTNEYTYFISNSELEFIKLLRKNNKLYSLIMGEPKRMMELIEKKLK